LAGDPLTVQWSTKESSIDVEGMLWGGSLAMICSLIVTPYLPAVDGGILFVEDVNEHPYRIERMLLQLDEVGILRRQQALVLGDFTSYRTTDYDRGYGLASVVDFLQKRIGIPIITGLPFGHAAQKLTLPVGAIVRLRAQGPQMHLSSAPPASQRALQ
jgi:muramoyltetrapeptide carboxypeptidase